MGAVRFIFPLLIALVLNPASSLADLLAIADGRISPLPRQGNFSLGNRQFVEPIRGLTDKRAHNYRPLGYRSSAVAPLDRQWIRFNDGPPSGVDDQASALTVDSSGFVYVVGTSGLFPDLDYLTVKYSPNGDTVWTRRYDGSANSLDFGHACAVDQEGNVLATGGSILADPHYDYLTVKYAHNGDTLWTRRYDGSAADDDFAYAMAVDETGNIYVTGQTNGTEGDVTTIKYTKTGDVAWIRTFDGSAHRDDRANVVVLDRTGNVLVAGWTFTSSGSWDFLTIKYDPSGNVLWLAQWNGIGNSADQAFGLGTDAADNVYVAGRSVGAGTGFDYGLVKYDASGNLQWARRFNGVGNGRDDGYACAVDESGNCHVTGFSVGAGSSEDIVTIKYTPNGDSLWVRGYNGPANLDDYAYAVVVDQRGLVYVGGLSNGGPTNYDIVTLVYLPNGALVAEDRINGTANGYDNPGNGSYPTPYLALDAAGNAYLTGFASNLNTFTDFVTVKYTRATVDVPRDGLGVPSGIVPTIARVSPNPIAGPCVARVEVPKATNLSLGIFDVQGVRCAAFWDQRSTAAGSYEIEMNLAGLHPGVYFLKLDTETMSESRRIIVVR